MWARALSVGVGVWLMAAPAVLSHAGETVGSSDRIAGPTAAAIGIVAMWQVTRALRWVNVPIGLWLIVAGPVLGAPAPAVVSDVLSGAVLIATALVRGRTAQRYGGGWRSLLGRWAPDPDDG